MSRSWSQWFTPDDLRQVCPCQSVGARIMGTEAIDCQRITAERNRNMLLMCMLVLTGSPVVQPAGSIDDVVEMLWKL